MELKLGPLDILIIVAYFAATIAMGFWLGRKQQGTKEYFLGSRDLPAWALLLSIVSMETSSVTFLSVPGQSYSPGGDCRFLQLALGLIVGRFLVAWLFMPGFFRGEILTAYQVLHDRFGGAVQMTASAIFLVMRTLADGIRLYLTALVLQAAVGLDLNVSILVLGVTMILFTLFGGQKAVIWTDVIQFVIYLAGALLALWVIVSRLPGGWDQLVGHGMATGKWRVFVPSLDLTEPYTLLAGVLGGAFLTLTTHGTDQIMVQRYVSSRSQRTASIAVVASGFVVFVQFALFLAIGVGLSAFYDGNSSLKSDQIFADFIVNRMPTGLVGLTIAALLAAALSSSLNASTAAVINDFYLRIVSTRPDEADLMLLSRALTVAFGFAQIVVGILGQNSNRSVVDRVLGIAGQTAGLILGVFLLGVLTRHVRQGPALVGLITGALIVGLLGYLPTDLLQSALTWPAGLKVFPLAWTWFALIGSLSTFAAGLLAEALWPRRVDMSEG